jgi:hypothetical protein
MANAQGNTHDPGDAEFVGCRRIRLPQRIFSSPLMTAQCGSSICDAPLFPFDDDVAYWPQANWMPIPTWTASDGGADV